MLEKNTGTFKRKKWGGNTVLGTNNRISTHCHGNHLFQQQLLRLQKDAGGNF